MDALYDHRCGHCGGFTNSAEHKIKFSAEALTRGLQEIFGGFNVKDNIQADIFRETLRLFNQAAARGISEAYDENAITDAFLEQVRHNNEVFSAFRTHRMQNDIARQLLDDKGRLKSYEQFRRDVAPLTGKYCDQWLNTEYNTAVIRAHRAADWKHFETEIDVYPNLRWAQTTSAVPDKVHQFFWSQKLTLPVNDPFWQRHHPGERWGCKCTCEQTDKPVNDLGGLAAKYEDTASKGLHGNPAQTGQLFSEDHPYYPKNCGSCPFTKGAKNRMRLFLNKEKDCSKCQYVDSCINDLKGDKELLKQRRAEFRKLQKDENYIDVRFDKKTGGVTATHKGHITHDGPKAQRFFEGLTSSDLERECLEQLFRTGHSVIFLDESKRANGNQLPALDMILDNVMMDIRSITGKGWYSNVFVKKNEQLRRFNRRTDIEEKSDAVCLYFYEPSLFDEQKMLKSINYFKFYRTESGELLEKDLKRVYCVIKGREDVLMYEI